VSETLKVLVVDADERSLSQRADHLLLEGHEVSVAAAAHAAQIKLAGEQPDVVLLASVGAPARTLAFLRELRSGALRGADQRVRVLSVGVDDDAVATIHLTAGSDLVLPSRASPALVAAAVRMLGGRARERDLPSRMLQVGSLTLDTDARTARVAERCLSLTRLEFDLMRCLASSPQRTFTKTELAREVWGSEHVAHNSRTLDSHVARVRHKLGDVGASEQVQTVRGVGFRLSR
jgi:DNA-binding response OmpR family regulator